MDEIGGEGRSLSPYHEKCFPPYCDNAHKIDKTVVSKMTRADLEDKYVIFADENLELKKQIRYHEKHIQRLQTAQQRQDYLDRRSGRSPASAMADSNRVSLLEAQNKNLQAKVKVLKQQLMNHSFYHSKDSRLAEAKRQGKSPRESSEQQLPSHTQSAREAKPDRSTTALKMRVAELENELESQKNKYKARISQLEKELSNMEKEIAKSATSVNEQLSETSRQVKDNTELIKLRMQGEKQEKELAELREKLEAAEGEIERLRQELEDAKARADDLEKELARERNKSTSALSGASKGTTHLETIRALEEQIRDLQNEKETLKDTNQKLLLLTQSKSDKSLKKPSGHELKISQLEQTLEDTMKELEEKKARIIELERRKESGPKSPCDEELPCEQCKNFKRQLCGALIENQKLKADLDEAKKNIRSCPPTPKQSETELNNLRDEVKRLTDEVKRLRDELERLKNERDMLKDERDRLIDERDKLKDERDRMSNERDRLIDERDRLKNEKDKSNDDWDRLNDERNKLKNERDRLNDDLERLIGERERLIKQLNEAAEELNVLRPIAAEHENCRRDPTPFTSQKSIQYSTQSVSFKEPTIHAEDSDDALKKQNERLEDELNKALQELRQLRPVAEEHKRCKEPITRKEFILPEMCREYVGQMAPPPLYQVSSVLAPATPVRSYTSPVRSLVSQNKSERPVVSAQRSYASPARSVIKAPSDYVSHVTPPPSLHCVETVGLNDPAQKANLVIVSKHDFETVLMQKKRFSTEVEMVELMDGKQVLNCKLEICMYDLDIDDRMLEYLSSIQAEPKVYVEWSFVGLDQRTAPLPAEQALFYTNVMYYGPLSSEIKTYLNKVEMPIDLYLVKSSGNPVKVAEGTLDLLPAMEQPNRGFMRSAFLRGKDLPGRYATDKAVATIHCSFILHECCIGDPPFRDQLEVAIGTLYLKNRDGGVVPDHATHIYIEYALLGHCGPDLETDSVPRGEVMKFNHSKKLKVNEENAPHLKAMLEDQNPQPLRFTVLAEPCNLLSESEVETVGHADVNLNEEMIRRNQDLISSQVPVYSNEGEHLGTLSVTVLGIGTLQQLYAERAR